MKCPRGTKNGVWVRVSPKKQELRDEQRFPAANRQFKLENSKNAILFWTSFRIFSKMVVPSRPFLKNAKSVKKSDQIPVGGGNDNQLAYRGASDIRSYATLPSLGHTSDGRELHLHRSELVWGCFGVVIAGLFSGLVFGSFSKKQPQKEPHKSKNSPKIAQKRSPKLTPKKVPRKLPQKTVLWVY